MELIEMKENVRGRALIKQEKSMKKKNEEIEIEQTYDRHDNTQNV